MQIKVTQESATLKLPSAIGAGNLFGLFSLCKSIRESQGPVVLDGQDVTFVDPLGIAVLGATLEIASVDRPVEIEWLPVKIGSYLDRMDVIQRCAIAGVETGNHYRRDRSDALVELTRVSQEHQVDEAAAKLTHALAGHLTGADPNAPVDEHSGFNEFRSYQHPLQYAMSELLLNSLSHAKREGRGDASVWLAAQYYPSKGVVQMAVVDDGCGMLATLKNHPKLTEKSHVAAIPAALTPWVSCNPDAGVRENTTNRGVGLTTTDRISRAAGGGLTIVSGDAAVLTTGGVRPFRLRDGALWPGVAVSMSCRRHMLPSVKIPQLLPAVVNSPAISLRFTP